LSSNRTVRPVLLLLKGHLYLSDKLLGFPTLRDTLLGQLIDDPIQLLPCPDALSR
jgi:hypothetical protein